MAEFERMMSWLWVRLVEHCPSNRIEGSRACPVITLRSGYTALVEMNTTERGHILLSTRHILNTKIDLSQALERKLYLGQSWVTFNSPHGDSYYGTVDSGDCSVVCNKLPFISIIVPSPPFLGIDNDSMQDLLEEVTENAEVKRIL